MIIIFIILAVIVFFIALVVSTLNANVRDREIDKDPIGFQMKEELKRQNDLIERQNKLLRK